MANCKVELQVKRCDRSGDVTRCWVLVDGITVGTGYGESGKRSCELLRDELTGDDTKAVLIRRMFDKLCYCGHMGVELCDFCSGLRDPAIEWENLLPSERC